MILINIRCAELEKAYDFKVDETADIGQVLEEVVEMISHKEKLPLNEEQSDFLLCDIRTGRILEMSQTLAGSDIRSGDTLFLV